LAELWNLPHDLRQAIEKHPNPEGISPDPLVAVVHAADILCRQQGLGSDGDFGPAEIVPGAVRLLRLMDERSKNEVLTELERRLKEAEEFLKFSSKGA
jgi:HD-like signal output (HDOD) protein